MSYERERRMELALEAIVRLQPITDAGKELTELSLIECAELAADTALLMQNIARDALKDKGELE